MSDSFTTVFAGTPVQPAQVSYRLINLTADITLDWPQQNVDTNDVVTYWNDVNASGSFNITLSPATAISPGQASIFNNFSSVAFNILANDATTIANVLPGDALYIINIDNTTIAGSWRVVTFGAGTSQANAASLAGAGLMAAAATLNLNIPIQQIVSDYSIVASDRATVLNWTAGVGQITPSAPNAAGFGNGWLCEIRNSGSGALTVDPASGNIDGSATKTFNQGESAILHTDGTDYFTVGYGRSVISSFTRLVVSVAGSSDVNLTSAQAQNQMLEFTGALTGNINVTVPANVAQYYVFNNTTGAHTLTFKTISGTGIVLTQTNRQITASDGTNIVLANSAGTGTVTSITAGTGLSGGVITTAGTINLANTAVVAGSYTSMTATVDAQGRITAAANGGAGSVTSITAGAGLSGGVITTTGTISLPTTGVAAATYTYPSITVDTFGRITAASSLSGTGRLLGIQRFTVAGSSTYTPTAGTGRVDVLVVGGGAGGGGCTATAAGQNSVGCGGGGGGFARKFITSAFSGVTVTVGAGGTGAAAGNNDGGAGGTSSFGAIFSATGGLAGQGVGAAAPPQVGPFSTGGFGVGGDINGGGGSSVLVPWLQASVVSASAGGGSILTITGANGPSISAAGGAGNAAAGIGGGGSGGLNPASQAAARAGGAGHAGAVIIYEYS